MRDQFTTKPRVQREASRPEAAEILPAHTQGLTEGYTAVWGSRDNSSALKEGRVCIYVPELVRHPIHYPVEFSLFFSISTRSAAVSVTGYLSITASHYSTRVTILAYSADVRLSCTSTRDF